MWTPSLAARTRWVIVRLYRIPRKGDAGRPHPPGLLMRTRRVHSDDMRESIVEYAGYRIRIKTYGPASGPHAVLLPGMGATAMALAPQSRALRALGYTTHVIELPGFGLTPGLRKADARFSQLADLVLHLVGYLRIERAASLGPSPGRRN